MLIFFDNLIKYYLDNYSKGEHLFRRYLQFYNKYRIYMTYLIYFLLYMSVTTISQNGKASLDPRLEILPVFLKEMWSFLTVGLPEIVIILIKIGHEKPWKTPINERKAHTS